MEEWNEAYGSIYKKISLGYKYLKDVLKMEFPEAFRENRERVQREQERRVNIYWLNWD